MKKNKPHIILAGACMSGNIGGAALYISFIEELEKYVPELSVSLLSKYPETDTPPAAARGWRIYHLSTWKQLFLGVPLGIITLALRMLRLPIKWAFGGAFTPYSCGTVLVDMSGISFSDDRPFANLLINSLWFVPALGSGIPIVKLSQAMGPFNKRLTKRISAFFLSRMHMLVCRGETSAREIRRLHIGTPTITLPDSAFCLRPSSGEEAKVLMRKAGVPDGVSYVAFGPSHIFAKRVAAKADDNTLYIASLAASAEWLLEHTLCHIVVFAHEVKQGAQSDLPECAALVACLKGYGPRVHLLPFELNPRITKKISGRAEVAIGSRFHFLVGTLSSGVPSLATAWSHKYHEMMRMLQQDDLILTTQDITPQHLVSMTERLWNERKQRRDVIQSLLPEVIAGSRRNAAVVYEVLQQQGYATHGQS